MANVIATLTRHKRQNGGQFLAGTVADDVELPAKARLELRKSDLTGDEYELIATSSILPGVPASQTARAREFLQENEPPGTSPF